MPLCGDPVGEVCVWGWGGGGGGEGGLDLLLTCSIVSSISSTKKVVWFTESSSSLCSAVSSLIRCLKAVAFAVISDARSLYINTSTHYHVNKHSMTIIIIMLMPQ